VATLAQGRLIDGIRELAALPQQAVKLQVQVEDAARNSYGILVVRVAKRGDDPAFLVFFRFIEAEIIHDPGEHAAEEVSVGSSVAYDPDWRG
jgi:hypothetical protein